MILAFLLCSFARAGEVSIHSSEDRLATLLLAIRHPLLSPHQSRATSNSIPKLAREPSRALARAEGTSESFNDRYSLPRRSSNPRGDGGGGGKKNVVLVGVCSRTGQYVARQLSEAFSVTALCVDAMGEKIFDDDGPLAGVSAVKYFDDGKVVATDAVILAFDDPPEVTSLRSLLKYCKDAGVGHVILLSRLGATKMGFSNKWGPIEEAAIEAFGEAGLSILRVGNPLEGGPFYAKEIDTVKWSSAKAIMGEKNYKVAKGDELKQGGVGAPRPGAVAGIAALLRRGPEEQLGSYSLAAETVGGEKKATTDAELDAMLSEVGGTVAEVSASATLRENILDDLEIQKLAFPQEVKGPNILDLLFNSPPAVSGQYWGSILLVLYGLYETTTPDYIAKTGVDLWGGSR